jgi:hypothetical protein
LHRSTGGADSAALIAAAVMLRALTERERDR